MSQSREPSQPPLPDARLDSLPDANLRDPYAQETTINTSSPPVPLYQSEYPDNAPAPPGRSCKDLKISTSPMDGMRLICWTDIL